MILVNIEAYDVESLRKLVRLFEYENRVLKEKLNRENIPYDEVDPFEATIIMAQLSRQKFNIFIMN